MSKVEFKSYYLLNKLATGLVMKAGYITLKAYGYTKILQSDLEHPDVLDAINRGWAEIHSEEPDTTTLPTLAAPIIEHESYQGMTAEELLASKTPEKKSTASAEAIGKNTGVEKTSEASAEAIGQTAEEANGVVPKRGRKASAAE